MTASAVRRAVFCQRRMTISFHGYNTRLYGMLSSKEAATVEDYWSLFLETGAPELYVLYRACQEEEACRENREKPSPTG